MKQITLIGWYLIVAFLIVVTLLLTGCSQKMYEHVVTDTVRIERVDSVIVNMRDIEVEVPVPQITMEQWVPIDTISILDNGLYVSVVEVVDGQIHHTLKPVAGATLPATVTVADTTHIHQEATHTSHTEKEKVVVKEQESWWKKTWRTAKGWASGVVAGIMIMIIFVVVYKIRKRGP